MSERPNLAWRCEVKGFDMDCGCIVVAPTIGKAKGRVYGSLCEAGYVGSRGGYRWTDIRVRRAPQYDEWARGLPVPMTWQCWNEDMVGEMRTKHE